MAQFFKVCSSVKYTALSRQTVALLLSTDFNLNAWESFTNDIKPDLAENKSWLKVICTCRNINTVMWLYVHKLACFTLEQMHRKLNTVNKNTPCSRLQISKLYTRLRFQKAFKTFLGCFTAWYGMITITWKRLLLQLDDHKHSIFHKILVLRWEIGKCFLRFLILKIPAFKDSPFWRFPLLKIPHFIL